MTRKYLASLLLAAALPAAAAQAKTQITLNAGGSSIAGPTYIAEFKAYTAANSSTLFSYAAVGGGSGQTAFLTDNINYFSNPPAGTLTYGTIVGTQVDFAASDAFLLASQLTNPATGSYGRSSTDGSIIQIPTFGVPIVLAFNESGVPSSGLTLSDAQLCGVLSGQINDWNTLVPSIPVGTTIKVVYFSNSSGATFLTTQHLNAVCNSSNSSFPTEPPPATKYFVAASGGVFTTSTVPSNFTGESAAANVASELVATSDSIGYLSPDYTSIAPNSANTTSLAVASLVNATDGKAYLPTVKNTEAGLAHPGAGSTNASPPSSLSAAMDPLNWIPAIPQTDTGYPVVGYSTLELSTCYASAPAAKAIDSFLKDEYKTSSYKTLITNNGFSPLANTAAAKYVTTVSNVFLTNKSGYNLNFNNATTCAGLTGR